MRRRSEKANALGAGGRGTLSARDVIKLRSLAGTTAASVSAARWMDRGALLFVTRSVQLEEFDSQRIKTTPV